MKPLVAEANVNGARGFTTVSEVAQRFFVKVGALPILLVALIIFFAVRNPVFIGRANLTSMAAQGIYLLVISLGQMLVLISGGFDLSVGSNVALTSIGSATVMAAIYQDNPANTTAAILAGLAAAVCIGLGVGLANGIGVSIFKVNAFIVTLATGSLFQGVTLLISQGQEVSGLPHYFVFDIGSGHYAGIPIAVLLSLPVIGLIYFLLTKARYGRYIYAIGSNEAAARVAGVRVWYHVLMTYVLCGAVTALAAWLLTGRVSAGEPLLGGEFALQSITAAVIGGTSLRGGEGSFAGTVLGAIFVEVLSNGMDLMRLGSNHQAIALGLALIFAVMVDRQRTQLRGKLNAQSAQ